MKMFSIFLLCTFYISCSNRSSDTTIPMYDNVYIKMFINNKYDFKSTELGSDCAQCYPEKKDNLVIFSPKNDTIGLIRITYRTPFKDSLGVNETNAGDFSTLKSFYLNSYLNRKLPGHDYVLVDVMEKSIHSHPSVLLEFESQDLTILQFLNNQTIIYDFTQFENIDYMMDVAFSIDIQYK